MTIYNYIRVSRTTKYRSAKAFWQAAKAPFSYEYYSNIERGTKFPNVQSVLFISDKLGMNKKKACFLWAQELMPDDESRSFFRWDDASIEKAVPLGSQISLEDTFLVTERHKALLESDPLYWEILSFFAIYEYSDFSFQEIWNHTRLAKGKLKAILDKLVAAGLIKYERKKYSHPKVYMHIPNDRHFLKLRNSNFKHAATRILNTLKGEDIESDRAFRTTANKRLSEEDLQRVMRSIKFVVGDFLNIEVPAPNEEGSPYTLCVLLAPRNFKQKPHAQKR